MATTTPKFPPIPDPSVAVVDPKTGRMDPEWYRWFTAVMRILIQLRTEV